MVSLRGFLRVYARMAAVAYKGGYVGVVVQQSFNPGANK